VEWNTLNKVYYGGDYNPDQWDEHIWDMDMVEMKKLGVNVITLPVFSWAKIQPSEDDYHFEWLDKIIKMAYHNGIAINLATPTAAQPAWMVKKYPDILPVNKYGIKMKFGGRTNFCPNSENYRRLSRNIAKKMAERYKDYKDVILWHINNEYGTYCYCEKCRESFIKWLKHKYKTLDTLNEKWYTNFWSHTYYSWDEIEVPSLLNEMLPQRLGNRDGTNFQAMAIDYRRFMSESILDCYKNEAEVIKEITPNIPITTNIWGICSSLDLFRFGEAVDVVSWDSYPMESEHYTSTSFRHDIIRSLKKDSNFILMEQTPNQQNWQAYNTVKRPGVMRLMSYQTLAHGADAILFFQMRQSRGACEKYHAALIPHVGHTNTRIGRELKQLGDELDKISGDIVGSKIKSKVALVMSWDNWWSVEYSSGPSIDLHYFDIVYAYYKELNTMNVSVDIIEPKDDMSDYEIVIAPVLNMVSMEEKENVESYVRDGGIFVTTYFSGIVDEYDLVYPNGYPGAFRDLMGIWVEEVDALYKDKNNIIVMGEEMEGFNTDYDCHLICEILHTEGAKTLATFGEDFYKGSPCMTENDYGKGKAVYIGTQPNGKCIADLLRYYLHLKNIKPEIKPIQDIEITIREKGNERYVFMMNHSTKKREVKLDKIYRDIMTDRVIKEHICLHNKEVVILKEI